MKYIALKIIILVVFVFNSAYASFHIQPQLYDFSGISHEKYKNIDLVSCDSFFYLPKPVLYVGGSDFDMGEDSYELSPTIYGFARELSDIFSDPNDIVEVDEYNEASALDGSTYANVSKVLFSYLIRQITDNKLDFDMFLSPEDLAFLGVGFGIRPVDNVGFMVLLAQHDREKSYGLELRLYPINNIEMKIQYGKEDMINKTGFYFGIDF